jgi:hypothetical protein
MWANRRGLLAAEAISRWRAAAADSQQREVEKRFQARIRKAWIQWPKVTAR